MSSKITAENRAVLTHVSPSGTPPTTEGDNKVYMARMEDLSEVVNILVRLESIKPHFPTHIKFVPKHALQTFQTYMHQAPTTPFACFFTPNAVMAGQITPCCWNYSAGLADEAVMRSNGKDGIRVLRAFERWAYGQGATHINCQTNFGYWEGRDDGERGRKVMERMGFEVAHTGWMKRLT